MSTKVIDLKEFRKKKEQEQFNKSRDKLIEDLDRSGIAFDNHTPLVEQIDERMKNNIEIWKKALGITVIPIDKE